LVGVPSTIAGMTSIAREAAYFSPVVGFAFAAFGEAFLPDPDEERITNLQNGLKCVSYELLKLENKIENLGAQVDLNSHYITQMLPRPMERMIKKLQKQADHNLRCSALMRCVADVKWLREKHDYKRFEEMCQKFRNEKEKDGLLIEECNGKKIQRRGKII